MIRRSLESVAGSVAGTWLAGLLVLLPLALTAAVLAWTVSLVNGLLGPSSFVGSLFAALGYPFSANPGLAYVFGTLVVIVVIYLLGVLVRSGLQGPLRRLTDRTLRRIPIVGGVYNVADRFVGLLDQQPGSGGDIAAMSPVWCFFGGDGGAGVLALAPSPEPVDDRRPPLLRRADPDRAGAVRRRAARRARRVGASRRDRRGQADGGVRLDGHHTAAVARLIVFRPTPADARAAPSALAGADLSWKLARGHIRAPMGEATAAGAWASGSVELASCVCEVPRRRLLDRVRDALRLRHYSRRTERAYVAWIRRYVLFHGKRHPAEMGAEEVSRFLSALAVEGRVSASTQNQALAALLFLYGARAGE